MVDPDSALAAHSLERLARLVRAGEYADGLNPAQREALRYLARANRFSNSPGALARYLGATKGTISQTLKSLVAKGLIEKTLRPGAGNSVALSLTPRALALLQADPWVLFAGEIKQGLKRKARLRLANVLDRLLAGVCVRQGVPGFGVCASCRFFREGAMGDHPEGPHQCMAFSAALSKAEIQQVCISHSPR